MKKKPPSKGKKFPHFKTNEEMARFVEENDISEYMTAENLIPFNQIFEWENKDATITMRFPVRLLNVIKALAAKKRMPYQRFIRATMEERVASQIPQYIEKPS